ncbi:DUF1642 domain-containing protein [Enterococcus durans]|uniref:DUF1642 domain-containing protein n=1 Tax=Enterococcus durans TaxID=53345 RepID=UPI000E5D07AD|nr:DUF1642 domain-containing protein [Enterococcus durans]RGW65790.1 DUF1642 domain-containing protein [Enterococcus durans]
MNKQEAIKKLESIKVIGNDAIAACYNESMNAGITLMKKIDEPQKPVVPKFVAEWIEYAKKKGDSLAISFKPWNLYGVEYSKADRWIEDNQETFARAWIDGYEVEKEPLYTVTINLDRKYHLVVDEGDGNDEISTTLTTSHGVLGYRYFLTEKEIKSADEKLWLIAVPVEEVAER